MQGGVVPGSAAAMHRAGSEAAGAAAALMTAAAASGYITANYRSIIIEAHAFALAPGRVQGWPAGQAGEACSMAAAAERRQTGARIMLVQPAWRVCAVS